MKHHDRPPSRISRFFHWFCRNENIEELEGDLRESYSENLETVGKRRADQIYLLEVLQMIRPSVIRAFHGKFAPVTLYGNYLKISFRQIARNKLFSTINLVGLAVSMTACLFVIAFLTEMYSYDTFHTNRDDIVRITSDLTELSEPDGYATTSILTGKRLQSEYPGFDKLVMLYKGFRTDLSVDSKTISQKGIHASDRFFEIFSFEMPHGNEATALKEPFSVVLTASLAQKLFGRTTVLNETVTSDHGDTYTVTGVVKDPPHNSHIRFESVASFSTLEVRYKDREDPFGWQNMWNSYVYLICPPSQQPALRNALNEIAASENPKVEHFDVELQIQAMNDIFPGEYLFNQLDVRFNESQIRWLTMFALVVILSACINYTNLSIARSLKRAREVGIRKVVGASRSQLVTQFVTEAMLLAVMALSAAMVIFHFMRPMLLQLNRDIERPARLQVTWEVVAYFVVFALLTGLAAGLFPAMSMSRFRAVSILKGAENMKIGMRFNLNYVLVVFQIVVSVGFVTLVTLTNKQYQYALNFDLGFDTENVLNIDLQGNDAKIVRSAFEQFPEVSAISQCNYMPSVGVTMSDWAKLNPSDSATVYQFSIDEHYLRNLGHEIIAGSNFSSSQDNSKSAIVNEQFLKRFGLKDPVDAIGTPFEYRDQPHRITGVVRDFHYGTIYNDLGPFTFLCDDRNDRYLNVRLSAGDITGTMMRLAATWDEIDPVHPMKAEFYDEKVALHYDELSTTLKTAGMLAIIAVSIALLGMLGMAVYAAETRLKELTIRKILGAREWSLVFRMTYGFLLLFTLSTAIAIPVSFYAFEEYVIEHIKYRANIGVIDLMISIGTILLVALITIGSQALRAARLNPVDTLRNE